MVWLEVSPGLDAGTAPAELAAVVAASRIDASSAWRCAASLTAATSQGVAVGCGVRVGQGFDGSWVGSMMT